jgi:mono/diheme cytochrome c family protein
LILSSGILRAFVVAERPGEAEQRHAGPIDEGEPMSSNRESVRAVGIASRIGAFTASLLLISWTLSCSDGTVGPGKPGGGTVQPPGATGSGTGAAGDPGSNPTPTIGAAGSTTTPMPDTGGAGATAVPNSDTTTTPTPNDPTKPTVSCAAAATPGAAPPAYVSGCSSCHGMTAMGRNGYPSLRGSTFTLADFATIVRSGRTSAKLTLVTAQGKTIPAQMPAFSAARVTDADIAAIFAYRSTPAAADLPVPAVYCLSRPEASWTPAQIDEAYQRGLKAWRTAGTVDQNACVFCHGADAIDLAFIGYTDGAIYRRAFSHVTQPVVDDVIDMVHALRAKFNIVQPPDPIKYRPFQPGGEVLPGNTAAERDRAFGTELQTVVPTLMGAPINSAVAAHMAWDQLASVNLRTLKVGIPLNRYTEDIFNNDGVDVPCPDKHLCDDHGTIADWITDAPILTATTAAALYPLHDAYLADPTLDNLKAILMKSPRGEESWIKNKYLAVQQANFLFRQQASGDPMLTKLMAGDSATTGQPFTPFPVVTGAFLNSIWMVGANQRDFIHNVGGALPVGPAGGNQGKFSVPKDAIPGLTRNNANEQLQRIIVPWFWLGFTLDPSTLNVEADYVAEGDEYFTQQTFLDNGGSPIHAAFIVSKRSIEMMKYTGGLPRSPNVFPFSHPDLGRYPVTPMTMRSGYFPVVTNFAEEKNFNTINPYQIKYTPTEPMQKALYQTYAANLWRMFMWVLVDELQTTPQVWNPNILQGKIKKAEIFLTQPEVVAVNGAADTMLIAQARNLVTKAAVKTGP